ncbi:hypothetical protein BO94DRAFT_510868 [Aspergillus sclerotioniger CBS 115572]|uniref:UBA domain-containing protein Ucp14 n=1 Tax=Aspergillus sclerotioniger CBS 115572 TaxID=1450535 RepID=A0A317X4A7_9EURO|nr:hypothetical protein BO94DRAFT_510868 [Aspergillus sclerotioniger CBS 115572]PWY93396.1 hypothetical protein BO94DRAFT_510868 [Aspergillus sclerotioniger CBS 115572]
MITSGLTNAPISKSLLIYTITSSVALAIFDLKHLTNIHVAPHIWQYGQFWRILVWQVAGFANSTEALFAAMLVYHLRVVERAWGKRKFATFLLTTLPYATLLPPLLLILVLRPITLGKLNYLPSGPVATLFALLAQYHASIPHTFRYQISTASASPSTSTKDQPQPTSKFLTLSLSDKSTTYLVAAQLALSQFPAMVLPAAVGWLVGVAWRMEFLPGTGEWRVPAWVVGEKERMVVAGNGGGESGRYEDLRRRLEGEAMAASASASASSSAADASGEGAGQRRRNGGV